MPEGFLPSVEMTAVGSEPAIQKEKPPPVARRGLTKSVLHRFNRVN